MPHSLLCLFTSVSINWWHDNEYTSIRDFKIYAKNLSSVCISKLRFRLQRLKNSISLFREFFVHAIDNDFTDRD